MTQPTARGARAARAHSLRLCCTAAQRLSSRNRKRTLPHPLDANILLLIVLTRVLLFLITVSPFVAPTATQWVG